MNRKQFLSYDPLFSPFPKLLQEMQLEFYRNQLRKKWNILTRYSSADNLKKKKKKDLIDWLRIFGETFIKYEKLHSCYLNRVDNTF